MSIKEAERFGIMKQMDLGKLNLKQASQETNVCMKQARRIRKRYEEHGAVGLVSRRRGVPSNRRKPESIRRAVMDMLRTTYTGFGPTLAAEKLKERDSIAHIPHLLGRRIDFFKLTSKHAKHLISNLVHVEHPLLSA